MKYDLSEHKSLGILLLRLLGVYLFIWAFSAAVGNIYHLIAQYKMATADVEFSAYSLPQLDQWTVALLVGDLVQAAIALYLIRHGHVAIAVLLHDPDPDEESEDEDLV